MSIDAGSLDRRVRFERLASAGQSPSGMPREVWRPLAGPVWAACRRSSGTETPASGRPQSSSRHASETSEWVVRWQRALFSLTPKDRMIHRGEIYDILAVQIPDRYESLIITAIRHAD